MTILKRVKSVPAVGGVLAALILAVVVISCNAF